MKTVISIPDEVFTRAEKLAKRTKKSRSRLYSDAVREYVDRHSANAITEAVNRVVDRLGSDVDPFLTAAARRTFLKVGGSSED
jgi:metal-responsive CopG/Arc/MetJ family transcriptional regulator